MSNRPKLAELVEHGECSDLPRDLVVDQNPEFVDDVYCV